MIKLSNLLRCLLLVVFAAFWSANAQAQCNISIQPLSQMEGCEPYPFEVTAINNTPGKTVLSYQWDYGDGQGGTGKDAQHFYNRGTYTVSLKIKYTDGSECNTSLSTSLKVYGKPTSEIGLPAAGLTTQCFKSGGILNKFCFKDLSKRSQDGFKVVRWEWNFGDGDTSSEQNPCHSYDSSGEYTISLEVWDEKGCSDRKILKSAIIVLKDIGTKFNVVGSQGCTTSTYTFDNKTDTINLKMKKWYWDFGDGSPIDSVTWKPKHTYTKDGKFLVKLKVINILNCEATSMQVVENTVFALDVRYKDTICWSDAKQEGTVTFIAKPIDGATYWEWSFDDPPSGPKNKAPYSWNATHAFQSGPKNYQIKFTVLHPICGKKDTCIVLHVKGPAAQIIMSDPLFPIILATHNYVPARPMPKSEFDALNNRNACEQTLYGKTMEYSQFTKFQRTVKTYTYCNAPRNSIFEDSTVYCDGDSQKWVAAVKLGATDSVSVTFWDSTETVRLYTKGDPIPTSPYYPSKGERLWPQMHDSDQFSARFSCVEISRMVQDFYTANPGASSSAYLDTMLKTYLNYRTGMNRTWFQYKEFISTCTKLTITNNKTAVDTFLYIMKNDPNPSYNNRKGCWWPDLVRFTNHSIKYRLYHALDDNPKDYADSTTTDIVDRKPAGTLPATIYFKNWPPLIAENGWKDICRNTGYPFASDSMRYLWKFTDPDGKPCTSSVFNQDWDCNFSTLIAPYHYYRSSTPPPSGCAQVKLSVTDDVAQCSDSLTMMLRQGPPDAWWDRRAFCKMTWEMQDVLTPGSPGDPNRPMYGFRLRWDKNCTGGNDRFRIEFDNVIPSCGAQDWWAVFDSAAATKVICDPKNGAKKYYDYGFLGAKNKNGYPVGAPKKVWTNLPWMGNYWWEQGDSGCKTVGLVLKVNECYDTAWYHDYICFNRLSPEFWLMNGANSTAKYDSSQTYVNRICHGGSGWSAKPGITIKLSPYDNTMKGVTNFKFMAQREEFPAGDYYYSRKNPGSDLKGFWPDSASLDVFTYKVDSINSINDTLYEPDTVVYTYLYDLNGNPTSIEIPFGSKLKPKELAELNAKGFTYVPGNDFRSRELSFNCKTNSYIVRTRKMPVPVLDTIYILNLKDPRKDDQYFMANGTPIHDTVRFNLPYPGFYSLATQVDNVDGCAAGTVYRLIYGHLARFNVVGGDSIICAGDTVKFEFFVRYWTINCPPLPGGPPPPGCIDGTIDQYSGILTPWDVPFKDIEAHRQSLNPGWKKAPGFRPETVSIDFGDGTRAGPYLNGTIPVHVYNKPGVYDVTLSTTDSNGCTINTVRRKFIKVIGLEPNFVVSPERDTLTYCRKDIAFKDMTKMIGGDVDMPGKFAYKQKVVRINKGKATIVDSTFIVDEIIAWRWDPGNGDKPIVRTGTDSLIFVYRRYGQYSPGLTVFTKNNTPRQCQGEIFRKNYLRLLGPRPDFDVVEREGCAPYQVIVDNKNDSSDLYEWVKGDGTTENSKPGEKKVRLTYAKPGLYRLFVRQMEEHYDPTIDSMRKCYDEWPLIDDSPQIYIRVWPNDPITISGPKLACKGVPVQFSTSSKYGEYETYTYTYGNGLSSTGLDSTGATIYTDTGTYWVKVKAQTKPDEGGCIKYDSMQIVVEDIEAEFEIDSTFAKIGRFGFINKSKMGVRYVWKMGDGTPDIPKVDMSGVEHEFPANDKGDPNEDERQFFTYTVCLLAYSKADCPDSVCKVVKFPRNWKRYNVLTPNDDGDNDVFNPKIEGETEYNIKIYNRWGEKVFESDDSNKDWNGKVNNDGPECPAGTYFYVWHFKLVGGVEKTVNGTVTLLR